MARDPDVTYPPLDVLKPVADNVWIVDSGPSSMHGPVPAGADDRDPPDSGDVWLHSPTRFDRELRREIETLGADPPHRRAQHRALDPPQGMAEHCPARDHLRGAEAAPSARRSEGGRAPRPRPRRRAARGMGRRDRAGRSCRAARAFARSRSSTGRARTLILTDLISESGARKAAPRHAPLRQGHRHAGSRRQGPGLSAPRHPPAPPRARAAASTAHRLAAGAGRCSATASGSTATGQRRSGARSPGSWGNPAAVRGNTPLSRARTPRGRRS